MASTSSIPPIDGDENNRNTSIPLITPPEQQQLQQPLHSDSETEDDEAVLALKATLHQLGSGSKAPVVVNGEDDCDDCSSPSPSAFVVQPISSIPCTSNKKKKIYTDGEEILLLQGLAEFWSEGKNTKWTAFHKFISTRLPRPFNKIQISEKIRNLKRKYVNNEIRARVSGGHLNLVDHELVLYELSKKLWEDEVRIPLTNVEIEENEKKRERDADVDVEGDPDPKKQKEEEEKEEVEREHPMLCASFPTFGSEEFVRDVGQWLGREKAEEFKEKWRQLKSIESELNAKKAELGNRDAIHRSA